MRDTHQEATTDHLWDEIMHDILPDMEPIPQIPVSWDDPDLILTTIRNMKSYKAPGVDGWRAQELKCLPYPAICDLAKIFKTIWGSQFTPNQMLARTVLLAKVAVPQTFSDGRPITILGYIPRLTSKLIADQLLASWAKTWSPQIAGGLPFRAVKDITIQQQFLLEKAHQSGQAYGGFTLDLVKAFNLIPRQVALRLLVVWGAPQRAVQFWIRSLNNMSRFLQIRGCCGPVSSATTGTPEGDAMSVCAMLVIAATFFKRMSILRVTPFTYADNWTFMSTDQRSLFRAFIDTLNFAHALRMKIDIRKSWGWGTNDEIRKFWKHAHLVFPAEDINIEVKLASKDLGCMLQYSKRTFLGCLKDRIQAAKRRLFRLQKMDLSIPDKASKIQTSVWPLAFYGAESQIIGDSHFVQLRRLATDTLIGKHKYASSYLAMLFLTDRIMDPLLYVIVTGLCAIRRLFHTHSPLAHQLWDEVLLAKPPRGPCSAMAAYLSKLSWIPSPGGLIDLPSGHRLCLQPQSTSEIRMQCRLAWAFYVHLNVRRRKGITPVPGDVYTQIKIMKQLSTREQKLVALNITGGYQTAAVKAIWDSTHSNACEHCGQPDTHLHRLLGCPPFQHVRDQHPEAVQIIAEHPHLAWLPLTTQHPDQVIYNRLCLCRAGPFLEPTFTPTDQPIQVFTDGTCDMPKMQNCCKAARAAIRQVQVSPSDPSLNDFDILQVSHVKGSQTINRGELEAVVWVAEFYAAQVPRPLIDLYTDSSFVQKIVHSLNTCMLDPRTYRLAHYDLIRRLQMSWDPCLFQLHKVKSHRDYADANDLLDLYTILGNTVADETAKLINRQDIAAFRQAAENIRTHSQNQMDALLCVYKYSQAFELKKSQQKTQLCMNRAQMRSLCCKRHLQMGGPRPTMGF